MLKKKTQEEIMTSGPENGNVKLIVTSDQRYGPGLEDGDWINLAVDGGKCSVKELGTRMKATKSSKDFELEANDDDDDDEDTGDY